MSRDLSFSALSLVRGGRRILDDVACTLRQGEVTAILGANGAGKSSLLSCMAGLHEEARHGIMLGERPLSAIGADERARLIGLLPQHGEVHWNMRVDALVALGRMAHNGGGRLSAEDRAVIVAAMDHMDIGHLSTRAVLTLSGGEQARVLLARVLAGEPEWLFADEPLASLDPAHQLAVMDRLLATARAGAGVAVILHDVNHAARIADHVILMKQGRIAADGPRDTVLTPERLTDIFGIAFRRITADPPLLVPA